jgi:hypothetical protein
MFDNHINLMVNINGYRVFPSRHPYILLMNWLIPFFGSLASFKKNKQLALHSLFYCPPDLREVRPARIISSTSNKLLAITALLLLSLSLVYIYIYSIK